MCADPAEVALVRAAITGHNPWDCSWLERAERRVRADAELARLGLTPQTILERLQRHVDGGGWIEQRPELREPYRAFRCCYYGVILPVREYPHGLFVEIILTSDN